MAVYVLGAPGSGKSTVRPLLTERLSRRSVIDWDDFLEPASELAGVDIRSAPSTWPSYRSLIRSVLDTAGPDAVLLGVCTPDELDGWPIDRWLLLDCEDDERQRRLAVRPEAIQEALVDAAAYRQLGLETVDSTGLLPIAVAEALVAAINATR